ncbi:MAG: lipopolysaccharide export system permease protein [Verrucomicrobiota bacterium]|nr:lipopolysaccharide export system permease protein [Verrucomicrobiota bacterium]
MKILDRYLARRFLSSWLGVNLVLAGLASFLELVRQLDDIGEGHYRLADALIYVLLTLPGRMLQMAPPSALLGSILALGLLAHNLELSALRASGVSIRRIGWSVARPALITLLGLLLSAQFIIPSLEQTAWTHRKTALSKSGTLLTRGGFWLRDKQRFINLRTTSAEEPQSIDIYQFDADGKLIGFTHADETYPGANGNWVLRNVHRTGIPKTGNYARRIPRLVLSDFLTPDQTAAFVLPPETLSISGLFNFILSLKARGLNADFYSLAFWQRLSLPVKTIAMIMLSFPFVFGPPRKSGFGWQILTGGFIGIFLFLLNQILDYLGLLWHISPIWTTLTPGLIVLIISLLLMRRTA